MKKQIAILGSTGSIGKTLINIIGKDAKKFEILLLAANKNHITLLNQAKKFNVKNLIITDSRSFLILKKKIKDINICVYNNFEDFNKIYKKKIDYTMSAISGIEGLVPTLNAIKFTKTIAIANKESIICGWNLIDKELKKYHTKFIPVDSEHFSIWYGLNDTRDNIDKFFLTASGGPFINLPLSKFKKINITQALNHPSWKMGKKISVDSSTMMNKVFEIIEAKNIFNISYDKLSILTHPNSYIHAIIKFKDGMIKLIAHDTTMSIPIFNSIHYPLKKKIKTKNLNIDKLNNLNFKKVDPKKFPLIKLLNFLPKNNTLFETVLVSANDSYVELFLQNKIKYKDISNLLIKFIKLSEFYKYKNIKADNVDSIINLNKYVRLKIKSKYV